MQNSNTVFKTLKEFDGKQYVELDEVLDLFTTLASVPSFFTGVAETLKAVQKDLSQEITKER